MVMSGAAARTGILMEKRGKKIIESTYRCREVFNYQRKVECAQETLNIQSVHIQENDKEKQVVYLYNVGREIKYVWSCSEDRRFREIIRK